MENKTCTKCKEEKPLKEFSNNKNAKDGKHWWCKECNSSNTKKWEQINKKKNPWYNSYNCAKSRCENPNNPNYPWWGAKGIKFLLSHEEMSMLWNRDGADNMEFPTIDREDKHGDYIFSNCQFLENKENSMKDNVGHWHKGKYIEYSKIGNTQKMEH